MSTNCLTNTHLYDDPGDVIDGIWCCTKETRAILEDKGVIVNDNVDVDAVDTQKVIGLAVNKFWDDKEVGMRLAKCLESAIEEYAKAL